MPADCYVHPATPLPPRGLIERAERLSTSLISDVFGRWAGAPGILPITGLAAGQVVAGPALTVRTRPGDNLVVHKALDVARPGEVLVVAAGGTMERATLGGLMGQYARTKGLAALVVDGAVRDRSDLEAAAPPVFAVGVSQLGPYKDGPGDLRCPVSLAGVVIEDGDLVVGDECGIAVIPRHRAEDVIAAAEAKRVAEEAESRAIAEGTWDREWIDRSLRIHDVPAVAAAESRTRGDFS
ncbi:dimethylmenaquinone methyltransferase [Planosporangium flavigriseum]|uniref:Putative 4-hydroxy-4-methyl-2-oxoglutarate aldolase n=1 Tax=Planosporangium flavigriseum TaxID=373681 RepID=A0A8J3LT71_9ACTN|nr:dimethylmenaquinone methyltransferase [Planosporangium flavigriseum]NJC62985.1 dimethylmenaquinone methyltransferase [Planosporangium flavigriseum]GIG73146.1 methyltransferase [Planosporangium flavigriseum]